MNTLFEKNIQKWAEIDPRRALLLPYLEVKKVKSKETLESAKRWFSSLDLKDAEILFIYGVDLGFSYLAAKEWLKKGQHHLIFLEDDFQVIYHLFTQEIGKEILHDPKVTLYYFENIEEAKESTLMLRWELLMKKIRVEASPLYMKKKKEIYRDLFHRIHNDQALHDSLVDEYLSCGAAFFNNFYQNIKLLPGAFHGDALYEKFKGVPAIICGAGPSLNKQFKVLKELQNKALIFAGGSSFNALVSHGITPHFSAGIDPNSASTARIQETCHVPVPFFFRNRLHPDALKLIRGKKLYIPGSGGYDISDWLEDKLKIDRKEILDEGHNVINFEVEIAKKLGCNPIIFVGMDLAFTEMRSYADGIIKDAKVTKKEILKEDKPKDFDLKAILKKDIYGKPIYTLWKWIIESEWMTNWAKEHKEITLINATEGGLGFKGIENSTLKTVSLKHLKKNYRLLNRIDQALEKQGTIKVSKKKIEKIVTEMKESLKRSLSYLDILLEEIELMRLKIEGLEKIAPGFNVVSGRAALFESDLFDEDAYKYILQIFSEVYAGILNHEMRKIRLSKMMEKKKALGRLELNKRRLLFLKIVAEVNLELIKVSD